MLIRDAEVWRHGRADVRIAVGAIAAIGRLAPTPGERVLDARGGALLPGLHDHHLHLAALAAARDSVRCGPPEVTDAASLAAALGRPGHGWLRGVGYHESVAGVPDRAMLDGFAPDRPVRLQHRSGRLWLLNSRALDLLLARAAPPPGLEREGGRWTGRLFDEDRWLRGALGGAPPDFAAVAAELAAMGVTGLTDMSPANDAGMAAHFEAEQAGGGLPQRCVLAGTLALAEGRFDGMLRLGPVKLHLHEAALPDLDAASGLVRAAHAQGRAVAVHCTTVAELVFALAAVDAGGPMRGDRIEHAGVAPDPLVADLARMGLHVVTQPHFIAERGDQYLRDVDPRDRPFLYRLAGLSRAGIVVAGGSDAPFGGADPWAAMRAAVSRRTAGGRPIGPDEALTPEAALSLYLADPLDLAREREITPGAPADLCLVSACWAEERNRLLSGDVRATLVGGAFVHESIDQPPA